MTFNTVRWLESVDRSTLTDTEYEILLVIAYGTDRDGRCARFTNKQLAAAVGKVTKTANRAVPRLIGLGLIDRTAVGNSKRNNYSVYDLVRGPDGLCVPRSNRGHEQGTLGNPKQGTSTGDIGQMSPVLTCGMSHPYREISKEISSNRDLLERDTPGVPPDASRPVGEGQEQSEPSEDVSSSSVGTSADVPLGGTSPMSLGASDPEPSTESEAMNKIDPWANTTVRDDPFVPTTSPAVAPAVPRSISSRDCDPFTGEPIPEHVDSGDPTDPFSLAFVPVHLR
jgi:hypothetical protein